MDISRSLRFKIQIREVSRPERFIRSCTSKRYNTIIVSDNDYSLFPRQARALNALALDSQGSFHCASSSLHECVSVGIEWEDLVEAMNDD